MASILDNLKNVFTTAPVEEKNGSMVGYYGVGSSRSKKYSYQQLAEDGFQSNAIIYRCISEISKEQVLFPIC